MTDEELANRLIAMAARDEQVRARLVATGELFGSYNDEMAAVHEENARALKEIVDELGWPGTSMVGADGAAAAWLVLQHAIGNPELQRQCLSLLQQAQHKGEVPAMQVAYLEDRICVFERRPQLYGTQLDWDDDGLLSPMPIENPERVDEYREMVGLRPLADAVDEARQRAASEKEQPPEDIDAYREQRDAWARSRGWR